MFVLPLARPSQRVVAPQLGRALDRLFDESFARLSGGVGTASRTPALDVTETDTAYTLALDVPGATRDGLEVSIEGRRVTVKTTDQPRAVDAAENTTAPAVEVAAATPEPRVLYRERSAPRYARTVSLPAEVDQTASQAKLEHGVLTLTLTKKVPSGATRLNVG